MGFWGRRVGVRRLGVWAWVCLENGGLLVQLRHINSKKGINYITKTHETKPNLL